LKSCLGVERRIHSNLLMCSVRDVGEYIDVSGIVTNLRTPLSLYLISKLFNSSRGCFSSLASMLRTFFAITHIVTVSITSFLCVSSTFDVSSGIETKAAYSKFTRP